MVLRRRLLIGGLLLLGVDCLYLILTYEPLLIWYAHRFRVEDPLAPANAIVMLLGGPIDRPAKVAELYRQGWAPIILMGRTEPVPVDETEINRQALLHQGIPAEVIQILPGAAVKGTHSEALRVRDYVRTHTVRRIIVVTTAYHTARTYWTFRKALRGSGVDIRMAASEDPRWTEANWHATDDGIKEYLLETLKTFYYRVVY